MRRQMFKWWVELSWIAIIALVWLTGCRVPEGDTADGATNANPTAPATTPSDEPIPATFEPTLPPSPTPSAAQTATPASAWSGEIAYVHDGNIFLLDLATGATTQLTDSANGSDPAWSPDGQMLAFVEADGEGSQIVAMRPDGSERIAITSSESFKLFPAYAPDGTLYFVRRALADTPQIEVVRLGDDGSETVVHAEPGGLCGPTNLSVGSENAIALSLNCGMGSYTFAITPGGETTDVGAAIDGAVCAADGEWADRLTLLVKTAVECAYQQGSSLTVVDLASNPIQTSEVYSGQRIGSFGWSPDNRAIVFSTYEADSGASDGLWIVDVDGGEPQRVLEVGSSPAWRS